MSNTSGINVEITQGQLGSLSFWRGKITFASPVLKQEGYTGYVTLVPSETGLSNYSRNEDGSVTYEFSTLDFSVVDDYHNTKEWAEEEAGRIITALQVLAEYEPLFEQSTPEENSEHVRSYFRMCEAEGVPFAMSSWMALFLSDKGFVAETDWDAVYLADLAVSCFDAAWIRKFLEDAPKPETSTILP